MPRLFRRFLALAVLLGAWALVGSQHAPIPVTLNEAVAGTSRFDGSPETPRTDKPPHDLSNMRVFTKVILYVKDNYVDPHRIKPKEMMISALEYVEKTVPDVIVDGNADSGKLLVKVGNKQQSFDISHVDSLWKMSFTLKDVFRFINENMRPMEDTHDVEYAAVNGMLSKLDPHSVLLRPELYREMKLTTKGEFGGLGFVIQMKEGNLTVVKVLPHTPAYKAGIKKDDQIKRIGDESTVNMDLNEAVSKLRGPVDSKVTITVDRKGWEKATPMTLARATITIESVQSKLLAGNVGYVRLKNFQGNTERDLQAALAELNKQTGGIKGLVLDLRGNPGGLLEQAIQVSDTFVSSGTIVATVGMADKLREEKKAHADDGDNQYPIAVLVNAGSASASEIVAGALKNLNRAAIIGRQTFGKGSVQVLYDFPDDSALKLTIAKYLTPGDVSIQEVGIVPDVELIPTRVTKNRIDVFATRKSMGEADLDSHFANPSNAQAVTKREDVLGKQKPAETVKYLKEDSKLKDASARAQKAEETSSNKLSKTDKGGAKKNLHGENDPLLDTDQAGNDEDLDDQLDAEAQDEVKEDFEVLFARDFVLKAPSTDRDQMLKQGKPFVDQKRKEEQERINTAVAALGVDWTPGATPKSVQLTGTLSPAATQKITAGEMLALEVSAENKGTEPLFRVRAWTDCPENAYLDRREFVFGKLAPGEKKTWKVPVRMPLDLTSRRDGVTVKFFDDSGALPETVVSEINFVEQPRPAFAFNWQILDDCDTCNGDGLVQRGETVDVLIDVTNQGVGKAVDSFAQIKNAADSNIFIDKGRFKLGEVAPGETKTARFQLEVKKGYKGEAFPLKLAIIDEKLEEFATDKLQLPVTESGLPVEAKKGVVKLADKAELYASPTTDARSIGRLPHGAMLNELAKVNGELKVELEKDRFAFVKANEAREIARGKPAPVKDLAYDSFRSPPKIVLDADPSQGGIVSDGDRFTLTGSAENPDGNILDLYVMVNDQKVFFQTATAEQGKGAKIKFTTDFPLKEGNNHVLVVARENSDFASRKTLMIRRRPAAVAQKGVSQVEANPKPAQGGR